MLLADQCYGSELCSVCGFRKERDKQHPITLLLLQDLFNVYSLIRSIILNKYENELPILTI